MTTKTDIIINLAREYNLDILYMAYLNGGQGSGNWNHAGRPDEIGGSMEGTGGTIDVKPRELTTLNAPHNKELLSQLTESMEEEGWVGDPVLITHGDRALTGSHRISAAVKAGLKTIPAVDIPYETLSEEQWASLDGMSDTYSLLTTLQEFQEDGVEGLGSAIHLIEKEFEKENSFR